MVALAAEAVAVTLGLIEVVGAVEQKVDIVLGQLGDGPGDADAVATRDPLRLLAVPVAPAADDLEGAILDRERVVGKDQVGVHLEPRAKPGALGAGAVRAVEGEVARLWLFEAGAAVDGAGVGE